MIVQKEEFFHRIKMEWTMSAEVFPSFLTVIALDKKIENERYITSILDNFQKQMKSFSRISIRKRRKKQDILNFLNTILYEETILNLHDVMKPQTLDAILDEVLEFLRQVRSFAPELTFGDIGQALRNYIVYLMFKEIHQDKTDFNMAAFGYSMLYPFTDNYIDSINSTPTNKLEYNQIIKDKIQGKVVNPNTLHHSKTCDLLQAIESTYPRSMFPSIYELLLIMLEAQELSLKQQNKDFPLSYEERLNISVYKGGISVLIDRFFVNKEITQEDFLFYLSFGFFLQLADDLQDIGEDSEKGYSTILTFDRSSPNEEKMVNKLLHYIHNIITNYTSGTLEFRNFLLTTCYQLIFTSVIQSKNFFSQEYLLELEKYLPVTIPFLEQMLNNRIEQSDTQLQNQYIKFLDELIQVPKH